MGSVVLDVDGEPVGFFGGVQGRRAYIAGPMRGIPAYNFPAFDRAAIILRRLGIDAWSPAERDREHGFEPDGLNGTEDLDELGFDLADALLADLTYVITQAHLVVVLPGWEDSKGAQAEVWTARSLGLPVIPLESFE